jgi:hypothetical protein
MIVLVDKAKGNFAGNGNSETASVVSRHQDTLPLRKSPLDGCCHRRIKTILNCPLVSDAKVGDEFGVFHRFSYVVQAALLWSCCGGDVPPLPPKLAFAGLLFVIADPTSAAQSCRSHRTY